MTQSVCPREGSAPRARGEALGAHIRRAIRHPGSLALNLLTHLAALLTLLVLLAVMSGS